MKTNDWHRIMKDHCKGTIKNMSVEDVNKFVNRIWFSYPDKCIIAFALFFTQKILNKENLNLTRNNSCNSE